jgi:tetratricopeptide (TPR) repeat protein
VAGALVVMVGVVAAWSALQPVRASHALDAAFERLDRGAVTQAASIAEIAHERDPLALDPLFELAAIQNARGKNREAQQALEQAVELEPANPETWRRLGYFRLNTLKDRQGALRAFQAAYFLNPRSPLAAGEVVTVMRMVGGG